MRRYLEIAVAAIFLAAFGAVLTGSASGDQPSVVIYSVENQPVTSTRPTIPDTILTAELLRRGYSVLPSLSASSAAQLLPRDVKGVWNADRRVSLQQHSKADVLLMATIEYKLNVTGTAQAINGTVSVVARAFDISTGESLWFSRIADRPLQGNNLEEAGRLALAGILPEMIADFDRSPKIKDWKPTERPKTWPPGILLTRTPPGASAPVLRGGPGPGQPGEPYTGVIIDAEHLRVEPSFRSGIYAPGGSAIYGPEKGPVRWSESLPGARQQAGPNPLVLKAQSYERGRIVLRDSDARRLQSERGLIERRPPTIVVQPPRGRR